MDGASAPVVLLDASRDGDDVSVHAHAFGAGDPPRAVVSLDGERRRPLSPAERRRRQRAVESGLRAEWPLQPLTAVWTSVATTGAKPVVIAKRFGSDDRRAFGRVALHPGGAGMMYWQPPASSTAAKRGTGIVRLDAAGRETQRVVDPFPGPRSDPGPIAFDARGTLYAATRASSSKGMHRILTLTAAGKPTPARELTLPGAQVVGDAALVSCGGSVWAVVPAATAGPERSLVVHRARLEPTGDLRPQPTGFTRPLARRDLHRLRRLSSLGAVGCDGDRAAVAYVLPARGTDSGWGIALVEWDARGE
jgi:hypothetical protein